jgi:SAM-dependent methyltransferase
MKMPHRPKKRHKVATSWQNVQGWYKKTVGLKGHYYHEHVILPASLKLLNLTVHSKILDLACGQGILGRHVHKDVYYQGIDASAAFIQFAVENDASARHHYRTADITKELPLEKKDFTHAAILLAIQNIENTLNVFKNVFHHLSADGRFLLVINHPAFRIPKYSSWQIDQDRQIQYRRVDAYMSSLRVPIQMNPSQKETSENTWSFHHSLSSYSKYLNQAGFLIEKIEEWVSDKISVGKAARMENQCRSEFPLFMAILAKKEAQNNRVL